MTRTFTDRRLLDVTPEPTAVDGLLDYLDPDFEVPDRDLLGRPLPLPAVLADLRLPCVRAALADPDGLRMAPGRDILDAVELFPRDDDDDDDDDEEDFDEEDFAAEYGDEDEDDPEIDEEYEDDGFDIDIDLDDDEGLDAEGLDDAALDD